MSPASGELAPDPAGAVPIFARAAAADARGAARLAATIDDAFLPEADRLDERTRAALTRALADTVAIVARDVAGHAARVLTARGDPARGRALADSAAAVLPRLLSAGLLREPELMAELTGQVRAELIGQALAAHAAREPRPSLLARLTEAPDGVVAAAASDLLIADSRRANGRRSELPAELHHRLVWWSAAALRERHAAGVADPALDAALAEAAQRSLAAHDEGDRGDAAAMRLAHAIGAQADELPDLLPDALADGRLALFVAVIAEIGGIDFAEARAMVLDPDADRLWLALRSHALDRATIARIGLALADADPRRDVEAFADHLDAIAAIAPEQARAALAPLALHRDFRAAVLALGPSAPR